MARVKCHSCGSHDVMRVIAENCPKGELCWEWLCFDCKARRPTADKKSKATVEVDGVMMTKFQAWAVERIRRDAASWHRIGRNDDRQYELVRFKVSRDKYDNVDVEAVVRRVGDDQGWVYVHDLTIRPRGKVTSIDYDRGMTTAEPRYAYRYMREE